MAATFDVYSWGAPIDYVCMRLRAGVDPNKVNNEGDTPIYLASVHGRVDVVRELVKHGADPNELRNISPPLIVAAMMGHVDVVRALVELGADIDKSSSDGIVTPLIVAAKMGHTDVARALVELGADINKPNVDGFTPLFIANHYGHMGVVSVLAKND